MRLVLVTGLDVRAFRGGEKYAAALGRELVARGAEVLLFSKVDPQEPRRLETDELPEALGVPVAFFPLYWLPFFPPFPRAPVAFVRTLRAADSIYLIESTPRFVALVVFLGRWLGRRVVVGLHHPSQVERWEEELHGPLRQRLRARLFRAFLDSAAAVHALTAYQSEILQRAGVSSPVTVVASFTTTEPSWTPHPSSGSFEVLFVGPLEREQKGIDLLVEVADLVLRAQPKVKLTVIGKGRDGELVDRLAERFPLQVRVRGFVSEAELEAAYSEADLLCTTSRAEAFPLVPLEGFAHGLPVVGFAIPGFEEVSAVYPEGRVAPFDTSAYAERVLSLYALWSGDRAAYSDLRNRCCASVEERFGRRTQVPKLARLLGIHLETATGETDPTKRYPSGGPASRP